MPIMKSIYLFICRKCSALVSNQLSPKTPLLSTSQRGRRLQSAGHYRVQLTSSVEAASVQGSSLIKTKLFSYAVLFGITSPVLR